MITEKDFEKEIERPVFNETAASRCYELAKQMASESKWIPVSEKYPEIKDKHDWVGVEVLGFCEHGVVKARYCNNGFREVASFGANGTATFTHWQPLPTPPTI